MAQAALGGCYYNVGKAETKGVEVSGNAAILPGILTGRVSYAYVDAIDLDTDQQLLRVPLNSGAIELDFTGIDKLEIKPRLLLVGPAYDSDFQTGGRVTLSGYARLDLVVNYRFNDQYTAYVRAENLTDTRYETVYNYGTPGVSVYAGLTHSW